MAGRIRVAKDKAELVRSLLATAPTSGPFQTYADAIAFAAALGAKHERRSPLGAISAREPGPIALDIFVARGLDWLIPLLALRDEDLAILSPQDLAAEERSIAIFEEYANGGLEVLQQELRGAVAYTERILLLLSRERYQEQSTDGEFDLGRFL